MKKIIIVLSLFLSINASAVNKDFFDNVIIANVNQSIDSSTNLIILIEQGDQQAAKISFSNLVRDWKQVEATYLLGDLNEDYLDTPRYIDIFHGNNEDIKPQLDLIIESDDDLSYAIYKHSHKTINALEYILFSKDISTPRVKAIALIMAKSISSYLTEILDGYQTHQTQFLKNEQYASAILLNALVAGTYKLKEWRIGDVAGLSKKYKGEPNNHRAEYALSGNSILAIKSILATHQQVINSNKYKDFGDIAREFGANKEIDTAIRNLKKSIASANKIQDENFTDTQGQALYNATNALMKSYYISLMDRLGFVSKVLDADGD